MSAFSASGVTKPSSQNPSPVGRGWSCNGGRERADAADRAAPVGRQSLQPIVHSGITSGFPGLLGVRTPVLDHYVVIDLKFTTRIDERRKAKGWLPERFIEILQAKSS